MNNPSDTTPEDNVCEEMGSRRLAAIMFTDVAGSSRLMGDDEDHVMPLIKRDLRIIAELCREYNGRFLKSMGDGCLAIFESAVHAVECAREIQRYFRQQSDSLPSDQVLEHRIGIHLGDVYVSENDAMGDGVNVAARLESQAQNGGICISQALYEVVKTRLALKTVYQGPKKLKNIKDEVHLYDIVDLQDEEADVKPHPYAKTKKSSGRSYLVRSLKVLAVLLAIFVVLRVIKVIRHKSGGDVPDDFSRLDLNGDMVISADEYPQHLMDRFNRADSDGDGEMTLEEFNNVQDLARERDQFYSELFRQLDVNGDGFLKNDELPQDVRERVMRADFDGDGQVDQGEFMEAVNRQHMQILNIQGQSPQHQPQTPDSSLPAEPDSLYERTPQEIFNSVDINGDDRITWNELPLRGRDRFIRADTDQDSIITRSEFLQFAGPR
ncbi:MAG: hypothetical protein GF388_05640 [Candidatus Aegiribacteria sp.]|nr:hypothetical protein [Candidatus Aegiribacteria sp.]MBD3294687.1 hypothetical protein [Candidatus Fermentibacteria bacterium]